MSKRDLLRTKCDILDVEMRYAYFRMKVAENAEEEDYWRKETQKKASESDNAIIALLQLPDYELA